MTGSDREIGWVVRLGVRILKTRWLVRAPIVIFRAGGGFLFGGRLILLEHTGRSSGMTRYVVLEVVSRPVAGSFVVASGFGKQAQWYRNVVVHPLVRVRWSIRPAVAAVAHILDRRESAEALDDYIAQHSQAWSRLSPVFESTLGAPVDGQHGELPLVRFVVVPKGTTPARGD